MGYDAFISYSHAADGRLAPAVQSALQRLAKPWYEPSALRVFRDESGLTVNPDLWGNIEAALRDSGWFVLLCSPEAAASRWVNQEVETWLSSKPVDRILPVLTDGTIEWDDDASDFTVDSTAIPPSLRGRYSRMPRYLDLRWAHTETQLDLHNSRFRASVAAIAAPIHGLTRDELDSQDVHVQRRTIRTARLGVAALTVLLIVATVASSLAFALAAQRRRAAAHAHEAQLLAQQRQLEAERAQKLAGDRLREAQGAEKLADMRFHDAQRATKRAVNSANVARLRQIAAFFDAASAEQQRLAGVARQLAIESGSAMASGATDTAVLLAAQSAAFAAQSLGKISDREVRATLINALQDNPHLVGWLRGLDGFIADVATAPDMSRAAAVSDRAQAGVWDLQSRKLLSVFSVPDGTNTIRFLDRTTLVVAGSGPRIDAYRTTDDGAQWALAWSVPLPHHNADCGLAATATGFAVAASKGLEVFDARGSLIGDIPSPTGCFDIAISPSGQDVATVGESGGGNNTVDVYRASGAVIGHFADKGSLPADLRFSANGKQIALLTEDGVVRWNLSTGEEANRRTLSPFVPSNFGMDALAPGALSPNLQEIAYRNDSSDDEVDVRDSIWDNGSSVVSDLKAPVAFGTVAGIGRAAFTPDGREFLVPWGDSSVPLFAFDGYSDTPNSHFARVSPATNAPPGSIGSEALSPDGETLAAVTSESGHFSLDITFLDGRHAAIDIPLSSRASILVFNRDGTEIAATCDDGSVDVFDVEQANSPLHLVPPPLPTSDCTPCGYSIAFSGSTRDRKHLGDQRSDAVELEHGVTARDRGCTLRVSPAGFRPADDSIVLVPSAARGPDHRQGHPTRTARSSTRRCVERLVGDLLFHTSL